MLISDVYATHESFGSLKFIVADVSPKQSVIITENTDVSTIKDLKSFVFGDLLKIERIKMDNQEPLRKELESFVSCIKNGKQPVVSGEDGIKAIKAATIINEEINKNLKDMVYWIKNIIALQLQSHDNFLNTLGIFMAIETLDDFKDVYDFKTAFSGKIMFES